MKSAGLKIIRLPLPLAFSEGNSELIFLATGTKPKVEMSLGKAENFYTFRKGPSIHFSLAGESNICQTLKMLAAKGNLSF